MKAAIQPFPRAAVHPRLLHSQNGSDLPRPAERAPVHAASGAAAVRRSGRCWPSAAQAVGILALLHSLVFLILWLFFCVRAGAAPAAPGGSELQLRPSVYSPKSQRDPFADPGVTAAAPDKPAVAAPTAFHLDGILYQRGSPSAIVNDTLLTLNKPAEIDVGSGKVQATAVEITRSRVVLEAGGQRVELGLATAGPQANRP